MAPISSAFCASWSSSEPRLVPAEAEMVPTLCCPAGVDCTYTAAKLAKERELKTAAIARVLTVFMIIIPVQMNFIVGSQALT